MLEGHLLTAAGANMVGAQVVVARRLRPFLGRAR